MRLLEWQAKTLLSEYQIPVPKGTVYELGETLTGIELPSVIKAQVPIGGRGKAGAIKLVSSLDEASSFVTTLKTLNVRGFLTEAVLIEEPINVISELYLSILYDKVSNQPMIVASRAGGMEIEQVAAEQPEKILKIKFSEHLGIQDYSIHQLAKFLRLIDIDEFGRIIRNLHRLFSEIDASLVEINPLSLTQNGLLALDCKIDLDDKAEFRHTKLFEKLRSEQTYKSFTPRTSAETLASQAGIKFIQFDGNVGLITDGAGTGMLTLDLVTDGGGQAANFCELGGLANAESAYNAIKVVLSNPRVKVLLISLIGGLTRMDDMAEGIAMYVREFGEPVPFVVRMCGTKEEEGREILKSIGMGTYYDIVEAVDQTVRLASEK